MLGPEMPEMNEPEVEQEVQEGQNEVIEVEQEVLEVQVPLIEPQVIVSLGHFQIVDIYTNSVKYGSLKKLPFQDSGDVLVNTSLNDDLKNSPNVMVEAL